MWKTVNKYVLGASVAAALAAGPAAATDATAATDLNLRADPNPMGEIVGVIPADAPVNVEACAEEAKWCQVSYNGTSGWAYGDYLTVKVGEEVAVLNESRDSVKVTTIKTSADTTGISAGVGSASGALVGGLIAGPPGMAVGAVLGAGAGAAADPGPEVTTYVSEHPVSPIYVDGEVVVGASLPEAVTLQPVPDTEYRYVYVNNVPVVVDGDRRVVTIVR